MKEAMESGAFDAWMMGSNVQVRTDDTQWEIAPHPKFQDPRFHFRPAATPKLRPWRPEEVPVGAVIRSKKHGWRSLILGVLSSGYIQIHDGGFQADFAAENHEHSTDCGKTWKACGVMEGEE